MADDVPDSVTLECHKTGREYEADVTVDSDETIIDAACPYCDNRGTEAVVHDIRQRIDDLERRRVDVD